MLCQAQFNVKVTDMTKKTTNSSNFKNTHYIYGKHPALAALQNKNRNILNVLCTREIFNEYNNVIKNFPYEIVNGDKLNRETDTKQTHQGIAVKTKTIFKNGIEELDLHSIEQKNCQIAILDQITDIQNVGTIIRSAVAFGVRAILIPADNSASENGALAKAAAGTLESIDIIEVTNLKNAIDKLKANGFWIIGLDSGTNEILTPNSKILSGKIAIVLGSEGKGMRKLTKENCDHIVKVPMTPLAESLNVANAASIAFYLAFAACCEK